MPGGQLPWDTDVDMPSDARMWEEVQKLVVPTLRTKYRLGVDTSIKPNELRVGAAVLHHKKTGFSTDNYAKPIEETACGHQVLKGRTQTKVNLGGWWVPGPDNPGQYGRHYGDEYLKHVPHVTSSKTAYGATQPRFPRCSGTPSHACLEQFQTDGNIQFRKDKMKLYTLF
ncbi:unnamed protein product [Oikopleura dioica]|uniref:Uncharacterized protein n=1 Tax=Oikopleura dioica TaxID=34765 RepID=E4XY95_OIKDI|nr:unnamed protein product [Oikopleura dioica]